MYTRFLLYLSGAFAFHHLNFGFYRNARFSMAIILLASNCLFDLVIVRA